MGGSISTNSDNYSDLFAVPSLGATSEDVQMAAETGIPGFGEAPLAQGPRSSKALPRSATPSSLPKRNPRAAAPPARPTPLPKRPKGRWFVGVFILAVFAGAAYLIWNTWFRFEVYGVVSGRIIHVSPAVGGVIKSLHVREGTIVHQGELLATLENLQLEQQAAALGDALRIAQANLEAEITLHRAQVQQQNDQGQKAQADYVSLWGELLAKRSKIDSLRAQLQRAKKLVQQGAASVEEMERLQFDLTGETAKCEKIESAVKELRKRAELYQDADSELQRRCKPQLVRIETLQDELTRLRERLQEGELRSSVNGRVVRISRFAGEYAETGQDILEILENDSLEIILYVPQNNLDRWHKGSEVSVCVEPHVKMVPCVVERFADELEAAPPSIRRYYRSGEPLVPVYLSPRNTISDDAPLRLGSEVRLPYAW